LLLHTGAASIGSTLRTDKIAPDCFVTPGRALDFPANSNKAMGAERFRIVWLRVDLYQVALYCMVPAILTDKFAYLAFDFRVPRVRAQERDFIAVYVIGLHFVFSIGLLISGGLPAIRGYGDSA
jgi:hypothetical protein